MNDILEILDETPPTWDGPHVGRRLMEAMRTLRLLPMPGVTGYRPAWPPYLYEFDDLVAQEKQGRTGADQATAEPDPTPARASRNKPHGARDLLAGALPAGTPRNRISDELCGSGPRSGSRCRVGGGEARRVCRHMATATRSRLRHHRGPLAG